jgi:hypothetical protein
VLWSGWSENTPSSGDGAMGRDVDTTQLGRSSGQRLRPGTASQGNERLTSVS